ncbi:MAG TPA: methyltransferase domain-containing protein [Nitrospirae bacterium]|nr:methyltransferase domain-containing protein [Nitrospirota bacterium]
MKDISGKTEFVKEYYGKVLQGKTDLKTSTCKCTDETLSSYIRAIENKIDDEILTKVYGCGSPIPDAVEGCVVLDLGCGAGRDVYVTSHLVGPKGFVIGVDVTYEQLEVAQRHLDAQMKRFGYEKPNVEFRKGFIEDLKEIGIGNNSVDVVISNCVINLSPDKRSVFSEIFRILKPGGELYFSDVFSGRRVPEHLTNDSLLHGECLGGAMYIEDFRRLLRDMGCPDHRVVLSKKIALDNPGIEAKAGMVDFYSMTIRAFKLDNLEDACEDYGQSAVYLGTIPGCPHAFELDDHHGFITGKPALVCGNTASMLNETRFAGHFKVTGDRTVHYGPFDCTPAHVKQESDGQGGGVCC